MRLDTVEGFFEALRGPDLKVRLATLRAVRENPALGLAYGRYQGLDVVDVLVDQSLGAHGYTYWMAVVSALAAFDDPRAAGRFRKILAQWDRAEVMTFVVDRLSREPVESLRGVRSFLFDDASPRRVWATARLLRPLPDLTREERVRVACADPDGESKVTLEQEDLDVWRREIGGPFGAAARGWIEAAMPDGAPVAAALAGTLGETDEAWLVSLLALRAPLEAVPVVRRALETGPPAARAEALRRVAETPGWAALFAPLVARLAEDGEFRLLAVRAGGGTSAGDLGSSDPRLVAEAAETLARAEGTGALDRLLPLLSSPDWAIRAAGTRGVAAVGPPAIPALRAALDGAGRETETAIVAALFQLGDLEWLEDRVLAPRLLGGA